MASKDKIRKCMSCINYFYDADIVLLWRLLELDNYWSLWTFSVSHRRKKTLWVLKDSDDDREPSSRKPHTFVVNELHKSLWLYPSLCVAVEGSPSLAPCNRSAELCEPPATVYRYADATCKLSADSSLTARKNCPANKHTFTQDIRVEVRF